MAKKIEIKEGQVFYPKDEMARHQMRRIIGIVGDRIFFSIGGDRNYSCKRTSFLAWRGEQVRQP